MKFLLFTLAALTLISCSGKKRVPFDKKLINLQVDTKVTEAQEKVDAALESLKAEGLLCEVTTREERKDVFLVPTLGEGQGISYSLYEIDGQGSKSYGAVIDGFKIYYLKGRSMLNKDGSKATAVNGLVFSIDPKAKPMDPSFYAHFVIEDSQDRGIQVTAIIETKPLKGNPKTRELAGFAGCVKTKI